MDEDELQVNTPYVLAQIDQVMAAYKEKTGEEGTSMRFLGCDWARCDKGHWHKVPFDG